MLSKTNKSKKTRCAYFYKAQSKVKLNNRYMFKLYGKNQGMTTAGFRWCFPWLMVAVVQAQGWDGEWYAQMLGTDDDLFHNMGDGLTMSIHFIIMLYSYFYYIFLCMVVT